MCFRTGTLNRKVLIADRRTCSEVIAFSGRLSIPGYWASFWNAFFWFSLSSLKVFWLIYVTFCISPAVTFKKSCIFFTQFSHVFLKIRRINIGSFSVQNSATGVCKAGIRWRVARLVLRHNRRHWQRIVFKFAVYPAWRGAACDWASEARWIAAEAVVSRS